MLHTATGARLLDCGPLLVVDPKTDWVPKTLPVVSSGVPNDPSPGELVEPKTDFEVSPNTDFEVSPNTDFEDSPNTDFEGSPKADLGDSSKTDFAGSPKTLVDPAIVAKGLTDDVLPNPPENVDGALSKTLVDLSTAAKGLAVEVALRPLRVELELPKTLVEAALAKGLTVEVLLNPPPIFGVDDSLLAGDFWSADVGRLISS